MTTSRPTREAATPAALARRPLDAAEPARYALLGLLLEGPRHGYDLARSFAPGTALGDVVHLGASHLYALLARLERDGLIAGERQEAGGRPPRRVYHLTPAGRAAVHRWAAEPVGRPREMHLDFPLKLYVARRRGRAHAAALVRDQYALFAGYLAGLEEPETEPAGPSGADAAFLRWMRAGRIARTRAMLAWLERCADIWPAVDAGEAP